MTDQIPPSRMEAVLALLGVRDAVLLRPGRTWTTECHGARAVRCSDHPEVLGTVTAHWCDASCPTMPLEGAQWRLETCAAGSGVLGCTESFAASCDLLSAFYGLTPGGYARGLDQIARYRREG